MNAVTSATIVAVCGAVAATFTTLDILCANPATCLYHLPNMMI